MHIRVAGAPHELRLGVEPDRAARAPGDRFENIQARIVEIISPVADDDKGCAVVDLVQEILIEIDQRKTEVGIVMARGHFPKYLINRFVGSVTLEIRRY